MNSGRHLLLDPGDLIVTNQPQIIQTILGSCVAVTFHHPQTGLSGITHSLLPSETHKSHDCSTCDTQCGLAGSKKKYIYVSCSVRDMIEQFLKKGISSKEVEVRLFGGAKPVSAISRDIGAENIETARSLLMHNRFYLNSEDVGGVQGRILTFNTETGEVMVKARSKDITTHSSMRS